MLLLLVGFALLPYAAIGQVNKCIDRNGKISYSEVPCTDSAKVQKQISIQGIPAGAVLEAAEAATATKNRYNSVKDQHAQQQVQPSGNVPWTPVHLSGEPERPPDDKKLIADCEATRGIHCSDKGTVDLLRMQQTPITQQGQAQANAERRRREER